MRHSTFVCLTAAIAFACLLANPTNSNAQLPQDKQSVLAFDIYFDRLSSSDLAKATGMDDPNKALGGPGANANDPIKPDELRRVFGAVSAPPSVQSMQQMGAGVEKLDFNFFARLQFKDAAATDKAFAEMIKGCETETVGGKEYYRPPVKAGSPKNMLFHKLSADVVEIGTDEYMVLPDRNVFSANLLAAWGKMPKSAIRIAADLDGARHLIDEGLQMAEGNVPPMAQPALSMVNNMTTLRIGLDFSSETLLWLTATGRDQAATDQINATLGGLLAMAKGFGQQSLPMAGPDAQGPGGELLAALSTTVDGNDVNIVLPRPDGLEKAIGGAMMSMMAMGGGPMVVDPNAMVAPAGDPFGGGADPFGGEPEPEPAPAGADPFGGGDDPFN
ncbi:MAG: hypothetical protein WBD20_13775 [Pirellulaceae bacterium]